MAEQNRYVQGVGITKTERDLKRLSDRTFLSLWSHSGIYKEPGKELCDLLVIFENHILIFSDKAAAFPETGSVELDWKRWYKRAIARSAGQMRGAERWLRAFPDRLFLDNLCTVPFPLEVPNIASATFHRILVAHGAMDRCREEYGGRGSLRITPAAVGDERPFHIGWVDAANSYIHVFDGVTLGIVMAELDTITDFVSYLSSKEQLILDGRLESAAGEESLLAHYLYPLTGKDRNQFVLPDDGTPSSIADGLWDEFDIAPYRIQRQRDNEGSYRWDLIIDAFTEQSLEDRLYYASHPGIQGTAATFRIPARESRTRRRLLSDLLWEFISPDPPPNFRRTRVAESEEYPGLYYAFLLTSPDPESTRDHYRVTRRVLLLGLCEAVKVRFPDAEDIVGIATELGEGGTRSFDVVYRDARFFTEDDRQRAQAFMAEQRLFTNVTESAAVEYDYPEPTGFLLVFKKRDKKITIGVRKPY